MICTFVRYHPKIFFSVKMLYYKVWKTYKNVPPSPVLVRDPIKPYFFSDWLPNLCPIRMRGACVYAVGLLHFTPLCMCIFCNRGGWRIFQNYPNHYYTFNIFGGGKSIGENQKDKLPIRLLCLFFFYSNIHFNTRGQFNAFSKIMCSCSRIATLDSYFYNLISISI